MSGTNMRGLTTFITDIRHCKNKEQEQQRIDKELSKIRNKFASNKGLSGYQRKKYVWKLLYMSILGYEIDFGHIESANLINSLRFSEKYTGYIATGMLVNEQDAEIFKIVANSIRSDLSGQNEINQSLALAMIGAQAPRELTEQLDKDVQRIAFSDQSRQYSLFVRKKAILCLLRMLRKYRERYDPTLWVPQILNMFEQRFMSLGFVSAASSLLLAVIQVTSPELYVECVPKVVKILVKLVLNKECSTDYLYYHTPNPWLQVKLLKILQQYDFPFDQTIQKMLLDVLKRIIKKTEVTKSVNKNNADHGILFEATNLIIHYGKQIPETFNNDVVKLLGIFISVREPNLKYLGLETMCKLSAINENLIEENDNLKTVLKSLRVNDISIKRRALDLLYLSCTPSTATKIVEELLAYAEDWADIQIKEELVLKIAILAERYAENLIWYIDVVVRLVGTSAGDFVTDDIWHRIIQIITGFGKEANAELQRHAALKLFSALNVPHVHETLLKIGAYILSEYSQFLVEQKRDPQQIFDILNRHFVQASEATKSMILSAFAKLSTRFPQLKDQAQIIFSQNSEHFDTDIQQRSVEYNALMQESDELQQKIFSKQPPYSEEIQTNNPLLKRIFRLKLGTQKELKDPTVLNEVKKIAEESVEQFLTKSVTLRTPQEEEYLLSLKDSPIYQLCLNKLVLTGVNIAVPNTEKLLANISNPMEIKQLLSAPSGIIYQSKELVIQYKSEYQDHMGKIGLQFESQIGKMTNVSFMVFNINNNNGLEFNISPVKYDLHPQIMIQALSVDSAQMIPRAILSYEANGMQKKVEFSLPIFTNKFVRPVEMPLNVFDKYFEDYSSVTNNNYFKLDVFITNKAPPNVTMTQVLGKISGLASTILGFKVYQLPSNDEIKLLNCIGQFVYKESNKDQASNVPLLMQVEGFEQSKGHIRFSFRSAKTKDVIRNLHQIVNMYIEG